jgi:gliding motility-associated-like protein
LNGGSSTALAPAFYYPPAPNNRTYFVKLLLTNTACGGVDSTVVPITIPARPYVELGSDSEICTGNPLILDASSWPGSAYLWQDNSTLPYYQVSGNTPGLNVFHVKVSYNGCSVKDTIRLIYKPKPDVLASKSNDINCVIGVATLSATGGLVYSWTPSASLVDADKAVTLARPTTTTQYQVIGTTRNGCSDTADVVVNVDFTDGGLAYVIPTAFSPKNDGLNDCFGVPYWVHVKNFKFSIYDRWGKRLFTTSNPADCWDGTYMGKPQQIGNYVYVITGDGDCGRVNKKGNVILIR